MRILGTVICLMISQLSFAGVILDNSNNHAKTDRMIYASVQSDRFAGDANYAFYSCKKDGSGCVHFYQGSEWELCTAVDRYETAISAFGALGRVAIFTALPMLAGGEALEKFSTVASTVNTARQAPKYVKTVMSRLQDNRPESERVIPGYIDPEEIEAPVLHYFSEGERVSADATEDIRHLVFYDMKKAKERVYCNSEEINILRWAAHFNGVVEVEKSSNFFGGSRSVFDLINYVHDIQWHSQLNRGLYGEKSPSGLPPQRSELMISAVRNLRAEASNSEPVFRLVGPPIPFYDHLQTLERPQSFQRADNDHYGY